jgi:hypothetical protein
MIWEAGNPDLFPELKIPRSTIRSWLLRGIPDAVFPQRHSGAGELSHLLRDARLSGTALEQGSEGGTGVVPSELI